MLQRDAGEQENKNKEKISKLEKKYLDLDQKYSKTITGLKDKLKAANKKKESLEDLVER